MKKITILTLALCVAGSALADTLYVGSGEAYTTIQAAVDAASPGDTIFVKAGTYTEQVTLTPGKNLRILGEGRDLVTWVVPPSPDDKACVCGKMQGYAGDMEYEIAGFTFNCRGNPANTHGTGVLINRAIQGPLHLSIHDNRFIEDLPSGDSDHWATSMLLCHNRYAGRDDSGSAAVRVYNNIDETWGGMTMSNSRAYDIYNNVFDGCSDAIYNGHGCPDVAGQTFGDHRIYDNIFANATDDLHPGGMTPAVAWYYYGSGGGTHLPSLIEENRFVGNDTALQFVMDTDMPYPAHVVRYNSFSDNGVAVRVDGDYTATLNAENNWWGDPSGPSGEGPGTGDAVLGDVDYEPWLGGTDFVTGGGWIDSPPGAYHVQVQYGDITLTGGFESGNFPQVWDLTGGDLVLSFTYDATGLVDDFGGSAHALAEFGIRAVGYGNFNPTWEVEGAGVWLATDYDWNANTFDPDPPGAPTLDLDDKMILQKAGGHGEGDYNLPSSPPNPWANHAVWFDRDGVDPWQALMWGAIDGVTYNTGGTYDVVMRLHATGDTTGEAYMTVNGGPQGFYVPNWHSGPADLMPAGMTFTGDMTQMQVFYGLYGYGTAHSVALCNILADGFPAISGKANFGFVAQYKKGASVPEGQTEFVFNAADLNFHSTIYDWLVIAGNTAVFKGIGAINGQDGYKFMLTAVDDDPDEFRIQIRQEDEAVIYDNGPGQALGGGNIVIHTKKDKPEKAANPNKKK